MGQFSINIFDMQNLEAVTLPQFAERSSIRLRYNGGRSKLQNIIGSDLYFKMEVSDYRAAKFFNLYTNDEKRYQVQLINEDNGAVIWKGHLLPDQYREPVEAGVFYVEFVATDGLGTLKNQYLPFEYYQGERALPTILAAILKLTGLESSILISPALKNNITGDLRNQYIDGASFLNDQGGKLDAYTILERLIPFCSIFQESGAWYIYGWNKRNLTTLNYQLYNFNGVYIIGIPQIKTLKNVLLLNSPVIEVNTPRGEIDINYQVNQARINEAAAKPGDEGFILLGNEADIVSAAWTYTGVGFTAKYNRFKRVVYLAPLTGTYDPASYVELKDKLLLQAGAKVQFIIEVKAAYSGTETFIQSIEELIASGAWDKVLRYDIIKEIPGGTDLVLYSNQNGSDPDNLAYQLNFNAERTSIITVDYIADATAYYNIRFYQPVGVAYDIKIDAIEIMRLEANILGGSDTRNFLNTSAERYTINENIEIHYHDDLDSLPQVIRMAPLNTTGAQYDIYNLVLSASNIIIQDSEYFLSVPFNLLYQAKNNPLGITVGGDSLIIKEFIYNYLGGAEMLMQYDPDTFGRIITAGEVLTITLNEIADLPSNISAWALWADNVYNTSYKRFAEAGAEIVRNLYNQAHPILNATAEGFIGPRDLIQYDYNGSKTWYILDCELLLDRGETNFIASQNFYGQAVSDNIPPSVNAGEDITLGPNDNQVTLTATASDPDGVIVSVLWRQVSPPPTFETILTPNALSTGVTKLTANSYEFSVTVTDDSGLTASDTVLIQRQQNYLFTQEWITDLQGTELGGFQTYSYRQFRLSITPDLDPTHVVRLTFTHTAVQVSPDFTAGAMPTTVCLVQVPGSGGGGYQGLTPVKNFVFSLLLRPATPVVNISLNSWVFVSDPTAVGKVRAEQQISVTGEIIAGPPGEIINDPITEISNAAM